MPRGSRRSPAPSQIEQTDRGPRVLVHPDADPKAEEAPEPIEYQLPRRTRLLVAQGQRVEPGDPIDEGSLNPTELLELHARSSRGSTPTELYLVGEVHKVYKSQGVDIHDKHIELIVRQMLKKVRIENSGDDRLPARPDGRQGRARARERPREEGEGRPSNVPAAHPLDNEGVARHRSFISEASFQETTKVLTEAAMEGKWTSWWV